MTIEPLGDELTGSRVLVVDDEAPIRKLLASLLTPSGCQVELAADGEEALARIALAPPDLIVVDLKMPKVDGLSVLRSVKGNPETQFIPVIVITAVADEADKLRVLEAGSDEFLTKPFQSLELQVRVRSLLRFKRSLDELERAERVIVGLGLAVEAKDPYTRGHCARIAHVARAIGQRLTLSAPDLHALELAGVLHDLGKVGVPDAILLKRGPLNESEWALVRRHPLIGEEICRPMKTLARVLPIIRHHHERWDGSGYPDGLRGTAIPLTARILTVADVFDAMRTVRPYKPAWSVEETFARLREEVAKGWWDPQTVVLLESVVSSEGELLRKGDSTTGGGGARVS